MMKLRNIAGLCSLGVALISGCVGVDVKNPAATLLAGEMDTVCGKKWELNQLTANGHVIGIEEMGRFTFRCNRDGEVLGNSGINQYRGSMRIIDGGQLLWDRSRFASTKMAGPEALMEQENNYLLALASSTEAFVRAGEPYLILRDPSGEFHIEYVELLR
ncbi:META domain-containing protein [Microbulbifer pacificus]|uniref:META domain-containing protein n=1 Tax=Microbulbifer pacificus TaxID=407164 RepID=UPI000CF565AA|nr:META domain-containing protein [Microbulbifer pacificus]